MYSHVGLGRCVCTRWLPVQTIILRDVVWLLVATQCKPVTGDSVCLIILLIDKHIGK